jgi:hypothetical protein
MEIVVLCHRGLFSARHVKRQALGSSPRQPDTCLCGLKFSGGLRGISADRCYHEQSTVDDKGLVENLVGYVKTDLMIPEELVVSDLARANHEARRWMEEVNTSVHSEICAVPNERLAIEGELLGSLPSLRPRLGKVVVRKVNRLSCVRFGSARYSVPTSFIGREVELGVLDDVVTVSFRDEVIATHLLAAPGEDSVNDAHYGGPRPAPRRAVRPKTAAEKAFCGLGPVAETFIKRAAAAGITSLKGDLEELACLEAAHGRAALVAALERAVAFGRFRAHDVRAILAAGTGVASPRGPGQAVIVPLPIRADKHYRGAAASLRGYRTDHVAGVLPWRPEGDAPRSRCVVRSTTFKRSA